MTKLMEEWVAKASALPDAEQDALAERLLGEWEAMGDDAPLLPWQRELLEERLAEMDRDPDAGITLEAFEAELKERRERRRA